MWVCQRNGITGKKSIQNRYDWLRATHLHQACHICQTLAHGVVNSMHKGNCWILTSNVLPPTMHSKGGHVLWPTMVLAMLGQQENANCFVAVFPMGKKCWWHEAKGWFDTDTPDMLDKLGWSIVMQCILRMMDLMKGLTRMSKSWCWWKNCCDQRPQMHDDNARR